MRILFLTLVGDIPVSERGIFNDLLRTFSAHGHDVLLVSPSERRFNTHTHAYQYERITHIRVKSLNIQKTNWIEKGVATLMLEYLFLYAIVKYFKTMHFDLIIYSTPPITFTTVIQYFRWRDKARTYLLLKDIFPQNAIDLNLMKRGILYRYFKSKEKILYSISDNIGCMSPANAAYLLKNNPNLNSYQVEVNPNSIIPKLFISKNQTKNIIREQYHIPVDSVLFIYGGNLGVPQGVDFIIEILEAIKGKNSMFFLIIGSGTEYYKLQEWFIKTKPINAQLIPSLSKVEYDYLLSSADVGMIFLDVKFSIPNFPSRILSYMEMELPILLATDVNTDVGSIAVNNHFGLWSKSGDLDSCINNISELIESKGLRLEMGANGQSYLLKNYTSQVSYEIIMSHFSNV